jgi:hypothetical protein
VTPAPIVLPVATREALSSSYEELRQVALASGGVHGRGTGFALLIRSGMARWLDTCIAMLARPMVQALPPQHIEDQAQLPADVRVEVAMVLAQMALSAQSQGAMTC